MLVPQITGGVAPPLPVTVKVSVKQFVARFAGWPILSAFAPTLAEAPRRL